jgi:dUTP pyrophosphatase
MKSINHQSVICNHESIKVRVRLGHGATMPIYQTPGASGMDIAATEKIVIPPASFRAVRTGLFLELPDGLEVQVRPRSGLALKHGIGILNAPGTIDSDYRGEIVVILFNLGRKRYTVMPGDRIAQLVFARTIRARLQSCRALCRTARGAGGFGHTG